jgi:predicted metal-dependent RNase
MGQKVNPISMRLQVNKDWRSRWFVGKKDYASFLKQDLKARRLIDTKLGSRAAISKVDIERSPNLVTVTIQTAKAGVVIGRGGSNAPNSRPNWSPKTSPTSWNGVSPSAGLLNHQPVQPCGPAPKASVSRLPAAWAAWR